MLGGSKQAVVFAVLGFNYFGTWAWTLSGKPDSLSFKTTNLPLVSNVGPPVGYFFICRRAAELRVRDSP